MWLDHRENELGHTARYATDVYFSRDSVISRTIWSGVWLPRRFFNWLLVFDMDLWWAGALGR